MKSSCLVLFSFLIIVTQSCKKQQTSTAVIFPNNPDSTSKSNTDIIDVPSNVYIAGVEFSDSFYALKYWNNGKAITLHMAKLYDPNAVKMMPTSIFVSANDVYVTGYSSDFTGRYWKNGIGVNFPDSLKKRMLNSIFVSNNDVYIAGTESNGYITAKYWRDGIAVTLADSIYQSLNSIPKNANSIFVSGNDVYVAGYENFQKQGAHRSAAYWKNGKRIILQNDSAESSWATSIFVSGNDIYVSGEVFTNHIEAVYWKNGSRVVLSPDVSYDVHTTGIGVVGNDVFVSGNAGYVAKYWKNDSSINLTDGRYESFATSLCISDGDVYIAGTDDDVPKYWKNGIGHVIQKEPSDNTGQAFAIFVTR
jgi:hypothetical protein